MEMKISIMLIKSNYGNNEKFGIIVIYMKD